MCVELIHSNNILLYNLRVFDLNVLILMSDLCNYNCIVNILDIHNPYVIFVPIRIDCISYIKGMIMTWFKMH